MKKHAVTSVAECQALLTDICDSFCCPSGPARYQPEPLADVKLGPANVTWPQNAPGGMKKGMERYEKWYGRQRRPISGIYLPREREGGRQGEEWEGGGRREWRSCLLQQRRWRCLHQGLLKAWLLSGRLLHCRPPPQLPDQLKLWWGAVLGRRQYRGTQGGESSLLNPPRISPSCLLPVLS